MTRRTIELVTAVALGALWATAVREPSVAAPPSSVEQPGLIVAAQAPPTTTARATGPSEVWDGIAALGYVPVDAIHRFELAPGQPVEVELQLTPSPHACSELVEGRCTSGCFEVMAAAGFEGSLALEVAPVDDPTDVIAASLAPGRITSAGHCLAFPLGHAGDRRVLARVSASAGHGPVELTAWRHPEPRGVPAPDLTLRLLPLGTARTQVLSDTPECARTYDTYDEFADECRFHGSVGALPLSETCDDGCTWWTYRFDEDRLDAVLLQRTVVDVDSTFVGAFYDEAVWIAAALDRDLGPSSMPESLATWADVEAPAAGGDALVLQRRSWIGATTTTTWELVGTPGHHPQVELRISVSNAD